MTRPGRSRFISFPTLAVAGNLAALLMTVVPVSAAAVTRTWNNFTGLPNNLWSTAGNWQENITPSSGDVELVFGGIGPDPYSANNDISNLSLSSLRLNRTGGGVATILGNSLDFRSVVSQKSIYQEGSGEFTIENDLIATNQIVLAVPINGPLIPGTVTLGGVISGTGGLQFEGGSWRITNPGNSFTGGFRVRDGAFVELSPAGLQDQGVDMTPGAATILGSNITNNGLAINGGALKLTTRGAGGITLNINKRVGFQANGGVLDLTNSNTIDPIVQGGHINNDGELSINLNNTANAPAVIKFNGGQLGLSTNDLNNGTWDAHGNTLRIGLFGGAGGPLRVELDNGAYYSATAAPPTSVTIRGKLGGDPSSGPTATVNTGIGRNFGRFGTNVDIISYPGGLRFEDAVEVSIPSASRQLNGNITIAGTTGGHPGYVAFSGRATDKSNQLTSQLTLPGRGGPGQNVLHLGSLPVNSDTLAIETGGIGVLDARLRIEQDVNHGVLLNSQTVIAPGGVLRFAQSMSNFNFDPTGLTKPKTNANVGDILVRGRIVGQGTTASEAIVDIQLPEPAGGGAPGVPETLTSLQVAEGARPFGGLRFIDAAQADSLPGVNQDLVVNGSGFGGLRISANARPSSLFSGGAPDPVPNNIKLASVLTAARLSRVSGTGGYLTPAPAATIFNFPNGGMWSDPDVGLRVVNHNLAGVDVSLASLSSWSRNLAVDAGATVNFGAANPFVLAAGTLHGNGTVASFGAIQIGPNATISPGQGNVGALSITGNVNLLGRLLFDVLPASSDTLTISGNLSLDGRLKLNGNFGASEITIATYTGTLTGTFSAITGLDPDFAIDYGTGSNSQIKIVPSPQSTLIWMGTPGNNTWDTSTPNWQGGGVFANRKKVVFDDTSTGSRNIVIGGTGVSPGLITVNNSTPYTLESMPGAALEGPAALVKQGTGVLRLKGPATYAGGTSVLGGEVHLESANALPDFGPVTVAAGAKLDLRGNNETIEDLTIIGNGAVVGTTSTLTVSSLTLEDGATVEPTLVLQGDVSKSGATAATLGNIDLGGAQRVFTIDSSSALVISGGVSNGVLIKAGPGTLTLNGVNTQSSTAVSGGTLIAGSSGATPTGSNVSISAGGTVNLNGMISNLGALEVAGTLLPGNLPLTVTSLEGSGGGSINLGASLTINQSIDTSFGGALSGSGALVKTGGGTLRLTSANSFSGGVTVAGGILSLAAPAAGGSASIVVDTGGTLDISAGIANKIVLKGGTVGSSAIVNFTGDIEVAELTTSTLLAADPKTPAISNDFILTRSLQRAANQQTGGNLIIQGATNVTGADGSSGVRLRPQDTTIASTYNGTITVLRSTKFELQSTSSVPFSPAGSGKIVLTTGLITPSVDMPRAGTYSQLNLRNDRLNGDVTFGNDIVLQGPGFANINPVGSALPGSTVGMGKLVIGEGQILGVNSDDNDFRVSFIGVTLTGGIATFSPKTFAMDYKRSPALILGKIDESEAGSGLRMYGVGALYLSAANSYGGPTTIGPLPIMEVHPESVTYLGAQGALPPSTALTMQDGALEFAYPDRAAASQTIGSLSGQTGIIRNSDFGNPATLTVNQASDTSFAGSIAGNLGLIKQGTGKLALQGTNSYAKATLVTGGTLEVNGSIDGDSVTVSAGGILAGIGTISPPVTVHGILAPGVDGPGVLSLTGNNLTLGPGSQSLFEIAGADPLSQFDRVVGIGTLTLDGTITINLTSGFSPMVGDRFNLFGAGTIAAQDFNVSTDLLLPPLGVGLTWKTDSFTNGGSVSIIAVPEASWVHTIGWGAAFVLGCQRRRGGPSVTPCIGADWPD